MESKPIDQGWRVIWTLPGGKLHREDGPAVEWNAGGREYYMNGRSHRLDGPAIILNSAPFDTGRWWINGEPVTYEIHQWANEFNIDLNDLTDEDKQMIVLYWSDYAG